MNIEEAFNKGYEFGLVGDDVDSPYPSGSAEDEAFANGFNVGYEKHISNQTPKTTNSGW